VPVALDLGDLRNQSEQRTPLEYREGRTRVAAGSFAALREEPDFLRENAGESERRQRAVRAAPATARVAHRQQPVRAGALRLRAGLGAGPLRL